VSWCSWTNATKSSHPKLGRTVCSPSLSKGMSAPKAAGPPLVVMDWFLRGCVLFTHREQKGGQTLSSGREKPWSPEIRNLLAGGHETYRHALSGGVCTV
jgi:hypothetical protein